MTAENPKPETRNPKSETKIKGSRNERLETAHQEPAIEKLQI
jgi:hypothetical protein